MLSVALAAKNTCDPKAAVAAAGGVPPPLAGAVTCTVGALPEAASTVTSTAAVSVT